MGKPSLWHQKRSQKVIAVLLKRITSCWCWKVICGRHCLELDINPPQRKSYRDLSPVDLWVHLLQIHNFNITPSISYHVTKGYHFSWNPWCYWLKFPYVLNDGNTKSAVVHCANITLKKSLGISKCVNDNMRHFIVMINHFLCRHIVLVKRWRHSSWIC